MSSVTLNPSSGSFPLTELIQCGLWAGLSAPARVVFSVIWDFHRQYPDTCRPSRATIARLAGVSPATVSRVLPSLEECGLLVVIPASGPGVNTYRVQWRNLVVPTLNTSRSSSSPYKAATAKAETFLSDSPSDLCDGPRPTGNRTVYPARDSAGEATAPCMLRETVPENHRHICRVFCDGQRPTGHQTMCSARDGGRRPSDRKPHQFGKETQLGLRREPDSGRHC